MQSPGQQLLTTLSRTALSVSLSLDKNPLFLDKDKLLFSPKDKQTLTVGQTQLQPVDKIIQSCCQLSRLQKTIMPTFI